MNPLTSCKMPTAAMILLAALSVPGAAVANTIAEAYSFAQAGESSCGTFGPTDQIRAFGLTSSGISTPGAGCGVALDLEYFSTASGMITAQSSASGSMNTQFGAASTSDSSSAKAGIGPGISDPGFSSPYGVLGVSSSGSYSGSTDSSAVGSSEALGMFTDGIVSQTNYVRVDYHLSGSQTVSNRGSDNLYVLYQKSGGSQLLSFHAQDTPSGPIGANVWSNGSYVSSGTNGITIGGGSITVDSNLFFIVPVTANVRFDLSVWLYGNTSPGACLGCTATANNSFGGTMVVTGYDAVDASGNLVAGATVQADSAGAPEPASLGLAAIALAVFLLRPRRAGA